MLCDGDWGASFSPAHRQRLRKLGLLPEQIELLESVLDVCKFAVYAGPANQRVRDKLKAVQGPLTLALKSIDTFRGDKTRAGDAARFRVRLVDVAQMASPNEPTKESPPGIALATHTASRDVSGIAPLADAADRIALALQVLRVAESTLPVVQQRYRPATRFPIEAIDGALREGFRRRYDPEAKGSEIPRYDLPVSRSGPFSEVVRICGEAVNYTSDPDRAIRTYLERLNASSKPRPASRKRRR